MQDKDYIPALDGLRGLAALAVVVSHLGLWGADANLGYLFGAFGVLLFFSLSGFLMSYLYASKELTFARGYRYAVSRASRILPIYLLVVVASYFIYNYVDPDFVYTIDKTNLLRHLLVSGNVSVLWSIPPEIQFYFFFVLFWWAADGWARRSRWPMLVVAVLGLGMLAVAKHAPGTTLPSKFHIFMLGALAGRLRSLWPRLRLPEMGLGLLQMGSVLLLIVAVWAARSSGQETVYIANAIYFSPICCLAAAIAIWLLSYPGIWSDLSFGCRPMRLLGAWSFAIYLIHVPVIQQTERLCPARLAPAIAVVATLAIAAALHDGFEKPVQAAMKKWAHSWFFLYARPEGSAPRD